MESPFSVHFNTNYIPSDDEVVQIKQFIAEPLARLSELDAEIYKLQAALDDLYRERRIVNESMAAHRTLISPIRRLPHDVFQEIFIRCLPIKRNAIMCTKEAPLLLTHVCRAWRFHALDTPQLWTSLHIPIPSPSSPQFTPQGQGASLDNQYMEKALKKVQDRCDMVQEWFRRSAAFPISISVHQRNPSSRNSFTDSIIKAILPLSPRWRQISLTLPKDVITLFAQLSIHDLPVLESLHLDSPGREIEPPNVWKWSETALLKAPHLKCLRLERHIEDPRRFMTNWPQLTDLSMEAVSGDAGRLSASITLSILGRCHQLTRCKLTINGQDDSRAVPRMSVSLPFLEKLSICTRASAGNLFKALHVPSLRVFHNYTALSPVFEDVSPPFLDFLSRWGDSIEKFSFNLFPFSENEVIELLRLVPSAKHICLLRPDQSSLPLVALRYFEDQSLTLNNYIIERLTPTLHDEPESSPCLCPKLEILDCQSPLSISSEALVEFIRRRSDIPGQKLRKCSLNFCYPEQTDVRTQVEALIAEGLELNLTYMPRTEGPFPPSAGLPKKV